MARVRLVAALGLALAAGLALMYLDTRPGFDDSAMLVAGIVGAAFLGVLMDGSGDPRRAVAVALLVGIWIPLVEIAPAGNVASLIALVFAAAGAIGGWLVLHGTAAARA
jgi:hypothetical protein